MTDRKSSTSELPNLTAQVHLSSSELTRQTGIAACHPGYHPLTRHNESLLHSAAGAGITSPHFLQVRNSSLSKKRL
jgi:hypothetical protein